VICVTEKRACNSAAFDDRLEHVLLQNSNPVLGKIHDPLALPRALPEAQLRADAESITLFTANDPVNGILIAIRRECPSLIEAAVRP
jgi:hypothetical protein